MTNEKQWNVVNPSDSRHPKPDKLPEPPFCMSSSLSINNIIRLFMLKFSLAISTDNFAILDFIKSVVQRANFAP